MTSIPDSLDEIDAAIFSGDFFHSKEGFELLKYYVERWSRALGDIQKVMGEE